MSEPLDRVLLRAQGQDYVPEQPHRPPWARGKVSPEVASTGDVAVVDLAVADRVHLRGLGRRTPEQPEIYEDCTPESWGVSSSA
jgi:hypothetical protein